MKSRLLALLFVPLACSSEPSAPSGSCLDTQARGACLPDHPGGKSDAPDPCAANGWYDDADGYCDGSYCAMPDPDCGPDPDACGDTPESAGMTWSGDASRGCEGAGSSTTPLAVVLTAPYCDTCDSADKSVLQARSPIVARVVEAIDAATSSVDVAQFTFSVSQIADALQRAHERGVKVRLAMDKGQDQPGTRARQLKDAGLDVRFVTGKPYSDKFGLLHAKFVLVDGETLLTGSNNFSSTGTSINEENTIVVPTSPLHPLVTGFACHFEVIWEQKLDSAGACSNDRVAFTPSSAAVKMLRDRIRAATESIDVIMHHFTFGDLVKELGKAAERGVAVRVLLNENTRGEHAGGDWDALVAAGGRIRYKRNNDEAYQLMHHKLAIVDGRILLNGSGNWSGSAFFNNFENFAVYEEPEVLAPMRELYHRLWTWSLSASALDGGQDAATQHASAVRSYYGNFHAHFAAQEAGVELDDGKAERLNELGEKVPVAMPSDVGGAARFAFEYARDKGQLDFMALSPHTRDDAAGETEANMTATGFAAVREAAAQTSSEQFLALAGMEWSSNSVGNHVGVIGSTQIAKTERGRFDVFYGDYLRERAVAGERPLVMLNHPKTFRNNDQSFNGAYDMLFGESLLVIEKEGERKQKFNDFGIDDFLPLSGVRDAWIRGEAQPDPAVVDQTWQNLAAVAGPYVRMVEVTLGRGTELGAETPVNPDIVESKDEPGTFVRETRVHSDYDYFLTRGLRVAPVASHDNHMANWGTGHTSRTAVLAERLGQRELLDAVEQRELFASEDENLDVRFYADGRVPMGSRHASRNASVPGRVVLSDPDYSGSYVIRVFTGLVGQDGVTVAQELTGLSAGTHALNLQLDASGERFFYLEVWQVDSDRMAWTAPIWIERL